MSCGDEDRCERWQIADTRSGSLWSCQGARVLADLRASGPQGCSANWTARESSQHLHPERYEGAV